jgi:hypothetical protein
LQADRFPRPFRLKLIAYQLRVVYDPKLKSYLSSLTCSSQFEFFNGADYIPQWHSLLNCATTFPLIFQAIRSAFVGAHDPLNCGM